MKKIHFTFSGSVQGVGFRFTAENLARVYGIKGWVKNLASGKVELVAQAEKENIELYISALKGKFRITSIDSYEENSPPFSGFSVEY